MPLYIPEKCLRGLDSCEPYAQIEADDGKSFICMGKNDGTTRDIEQDEFTVCWKNELFDDMSHWDKRDVADTISVLAQGMSVHENIIANGQEEK